MLSLGEYHNYYSTWYTRQMDARTADDLARGIIGDVVVSVDGTGIKAGIIGEIGCTWPLAPNERKSLTAGANRPARDGRGDIDPSRDGTRTRRPRSWRCLRKAAQTCPG